MHRWLSLALLTALGITSPSLAAPQEDKKEAQEEAKSPEEKLKAIQQEYNKKQQDFFKAYGAAKTKDEKKKVLESLEPKPKPYLERALKLAEDHPDSSAATDALTWIMQTSPMTPEGNRAESLLAKGFVAKATLADLSGKLSRTRLTYASTLAEAVLNRAKEHLDDKNAPKLLAWVHSSSRYGQGRQFGESAAQLLFEKFPDDDMLAGVCQTFGSSRDGQGASQLRSVLTRSKNRKVLAAATFGLAMLLKAQEGDAQKEAEQLLEKVTTEYAADSKPFADQAKGELREIRLLGIGKPLPEIEGEDLQGKTFKISEYRGKVVLLDFWGFW